jgi:Domain of unknown function (DUF4386)
MHGDRRTAVVVGVLFIIATVASILGSVVLGSALDGDDYLTSVSADQIVPAALLFLVAATSAFGTAVLLYPILRKHSEGLAAGYVGLRAFENILYVTGVVALLMMLSVSASDAVEQAAATDLRLVGSALLALQRWAVVLGTLIFAGLGGLTLNSVLYRSRLVPRWLSVWGLVGALGIVTYGLLGIFGVDTGLGSPYMLLAMPLAFQEMVFAGYLIARGLRVNTERPREVPKPQVQPAGLPG